VIRVFLVDDHEVVRRGVRDLLETADDLEVVGEAGTAAEAVDRAPATSPDVAVLDVRLPDGSGIEVCRDLRSMLPALRCLMLTSFNDDETLFDAVMAGASGYVLKEVRGVELIDSVRSVAAGRSLFDPLATAGVLERIRNPPRDAVTATLSPQGDSHPRTPRRRSHEPPAHSGDVPGREDGQELRLQPPRQARDDPPHASRRLRRPAGRTPQPWPVRPRAAEHNVTPTVVCVL
jgi:two-component system, NarL family, response regulator DevR